MWPGIETLDMVGISLCLVLTNSIWIKHLGRIQTSTDVHYQNFKEKKKKKKKNIIVYYIKVKFDWLDVLPITINETRRVKAF